MVVAADDGLDEISISSPTRVIEVSEGRTEEWFADPDAYGLGRAPLAAVAGGSPEENAATVRAVLEGREGPGADLVLLNAGAAIYLGAGAEGVEAGVAAARDAITSGAALEVLDQLVSTTAEMTRSN